MQPVIIAGIGRFGQIVNRLVQSTGFKTVVIDHDMETIQVMRALRVQGIFRRPDAPRTAARGRASPRPRCWSWRWTIPRRRPRLVAYARRVRGQDLHIVARARDRTHVYELYQAGADDIVREMFDSSSAQGVTCSRISA